jgi:hypothetical protein
MVGAGIRMTIDFQLYLITSGLAVGALIAAWKAFHLRSILRSRSSLFGAFIFLLLGARQSYSLFRLKANLVDARAKGYMIDHLSTEQWLVGVLWPYVVIYGFVFWLYWQHRDLKRLGV